jgi:Gpi18-like mannosyltransferase
MGGLIAAIDPMFKTMSNAGDPLAIVLLKAPGVLADLALAAGVLYALREKPGWAVTAATFVLIHPAFWYVSTVWGQSESVYVLAALVAFLLVLADRDSLAGAALAVAILTKPQAAALLIPFAAWFLATRGPMGLAKSALVGIVTGVLIWLPFLAAGGPANYVTILVHYQTAQFSVLSYGAWNMWWPVQSLGSGGGAASDLQAIWGPITFRFVGLALAAFLGSVVGFRVWRDRQPRTLALGLGAASLVAFTFLTTMHERYSFGALIFLVLLIAESRIRLLLAVFSVVFTLNVIAAVPASPELRSLVPLTGGIGIAGSIAMVVITLAVIRELWHDPAVAQPGS